MSLFVVSKSRYDDSKVLTHLEWAMADGARDVFVEPHTVVPVDRVVQALDEGDVVEMRHISGNGWVSSGKLVRRILPNGHETITEERQSVGQMLRDMPRC